MNFFAHQDSARRRTRVLVLWFALAVAVILLLTNGLIVLAVANATDSGDGFVVPDLGWLRAHPGVVVATTVAVLAVIAGASLFRMARLSSGGGSVARSLGGTLVPSDVSDPDRSRLRNVVEEIALASGVPVPEVYVLEKEGGINAFAAGFAPGDAAVAVSRGCLEQLTRAELQGVIAHEFSHILNGDMRINIRLIGVLFGILVIGLAGRQILAVGHHGRRNAAPLVAVGLGLLVIGFAGLFFSRLIQAAVSRQREVLADASAVQFTRDPTGIAGALKKIAAVSEGSLLREADATEVSHMLFAQGLRNRLFATHPPLEDRIRRIDPHFDPRELHELRARLALADGASVPAEAPAGTSGLAAGASAPGAPASETVGATAVTRDVGAPTWDHVAYAEVLRTRLDPELVEAARSLRLSADLVFALLLHADGPLRRRQLAILDNHVGEDHRARVQGLLARIDGMDPLHRLPLLELAFPALKRRPEPAVRRYIEVMERLIHADGEIDVSEFAIARLVRVYLVESLDPRREASEPRDLRLRDVNDAVATILAVLAQVGHLAPAAAQHAFLAGWNRLYPALPRSWEAPRDWVPAAETALDRLDHLEPLAKEGLVDALTTTLSHDGRITLGEVELLRAICASLHCPMPPAIRAS